MTKDKKILLPQYHGYGEKAAAKRVGTIIIIEDKGTVIDLVFYTYSFDTGTASGVGKDNKGNVYRVYTYC